MTDVGLVGRNVRRLRAERRLSLGELAARAGLAKQTLANLETGRGNPTVETLLSVARALGVGATWLLADWGSPVFIQRHTDAAWESSAAGRHRTMDQTYGSGCVVTAVLEVDADAPASPPLSPGALQHVYVVAGPVLAGPVDDAHTLSSGDFIRFPGDVPHLLRAGERGAGGALLHVVTTLPQAQYFGSGSTAGRPSGTAASTPVDENR